MTAWNEPIGFFARSSQAVERLAPIYLALDAFLRGTFIVPETLVEQARSLGISNVIGLRGSVNRPLQVMPPAGTSPMVTCSYRDLLVVTRVNSQRANIYLKLGPQMAAAESKVHLFLCASDQVQSAVERKYPGKAVAMVGESVVSAVDAIQKYVKAKSTMKTIREVNGRSVGIIYMSFGEKAARAIELSAMSLRRVGLDIPVCAIGSTPVPGCQFIEWTGESPFDARQRQNFQFRAGRIKPRLYELSPFERTMYIDADTEFMADITPAFDALDEYDVAIARESITLGQLYNKALAGWEINIKEKDATIEILNAGPDVYFLNSGVLFFRKSPVVEAGMRRWHEEWMKWQQWDEQLAFMRAFHRTPEAKVKILPPEWNFPHRKGQIVIFHNYGRGVVRMNVTDSVQHSAISGQQSAVQQEVMA